MYTHHFSMRERPFKLVHDPGYLYLSQAHQKALELLADGVCDNGGIFELTGGTGMGKTTVCHAFMDSIDDKTGVVFISNPRVTPKQLIEMISSELNMESGCGSAENNMVALGARLRIYKNDGKNILLLIDEAQNLSPEVVNLLCELSEIELNSAKLLKIVLVGQPVFATDYVSDHLNQLKEKTADGYCLSPMTWHETRAYILHRIRIASLFENSRALFSLSALRAVYMSSEGIPRLVNILCNRALITAYLKNSSRVSGETVRFSIKEMRGETPGESAWRIRFLQFWCLATFCLILFLLWGGHTPFLEQAPSESLTNHTSVYPVAPVAKRHPIVMPEAQTTSNLSRVTGLRYGIHKNKTRIVIDVESHVTFTHTRADENSLFIDMESARMGSTSQKITLMGRRIVRAETKEHASESVRTVIKIRPDTLYFIFSLDNPFRIVVDVWEPSTES